MAMARAYRKGKIDLGKGQVPEKRVNEILEYAEEWSKDFLHHRGDKRYESACVERYSFEHANRRGLLWGQGPVRCECTHQGIGGTRARTLTLSTVQVDLSATLTRGYRKHPATVPTIESSF